MSFPASSPTTTSDLRLYHGNDLDVLAELLARELAQPHPQGPLAADVVLIPQPALRRWLQKSLAERFGVAANLRFLAPGEYVQELMQANLGQQPSASLQRERLPWRLLTALDQAPDEVAALLRDDADGLRRWELAQTLARSYERYQAWRADWLDAWQRGNADEDWQAALWRRISHGALSRAGLMSELLRRERLQVPVARLFVFACINVSPDVLRLIRRSAEQVPVHLFVPTPCRDYWGDVRSLQERLRSQGEAAFDDDEHPLLASCGRAGREFIRLLFDDFAGQARIDAAAYAEPSDRNGLLGRLREDLLHRRAPKPASTEPRLDGSLQIHACVSRLREVEVAHALIRDRLERQPELQPWQIALLAPDLAPYAATIEAVFGAARGGPHFVPYQLAQADQDSLLPQALHALLRLPDWRFNAAEIERYLGWPWLAGAFGVQPAETLKLLEALEQAGLRWGWDGEQRHRDATDASDANDPQALPNAQDEAFSWRFALQRLLLGHAAGEEAMLGDCAALPRLEGQGLSTLDALLSLLDALRGWRERLQRERSASRWHALLRELLDELLPARFDDEVDTPARERILQALQPLLRDAAPELEDRPLSLAVVREVLQQGLQADDTRAPWLGGGVAISRMVPMRLIPYRMVVLLGMEAGGFPRAEPFSALDRLSQPDSNARRLGDRDTVEDDRFLFLQILASSERELHLCYVESTDALGASASPLLHELEDCALAMFPAQSQQDARAHLHRQHPDQAFDADPALPWAASRWSLHEARADDAIWRCDAPSAASPVDIRQWHAFVRDPAAAFLRTAFGVESGLRDDRWQDLEPFAPDSLQTWQWQQRALQLCIEQSIADPGRLHDRLIAEALLTADLAGKQRVSDWWRKWDALAQELPLRSLQWRRQELRVPISEALLQGDWQGWRDAQPRIIQFKPANASRRLRSALDALLLTATQSASELSLWSFDKAWHVERFAPADADAAREGLEGWLALWRRHLREPLPLTADCALKYVENLQKKGGDEFAAWEAAGKLWPKTETEDEQRNAPSAAQRRLWSARSPFEDFEHELAVRFREAALSFALPISLCSGDGSGEEAA